MASETTQSHTSSSTSTTTPTGRLYHGSCHCGLTRYVTYLTLPPTIISANPPPGSTMQICKCNCSTCHKMSLFYVQPIDKCTDFFLLSPLDLTEGGLKDYTCFKKRTHYYFCGVCGVRCFMFSGEGEVREVEIEGSMTKVWGPKKDSKGSLNINATSLDAGQEGLDLREWKEKGWICYMDCKDEVGEDRFREPHEGGTY